MHEEYTCILMHVYNQQYQMELSTSVPKGKGTITSVFYYIVSVSLTPIYAYYHNSGLCNILTDNSLKVKIK